MDWLTSTARYLVTHILRIPYVSTMFNRFRNVFLNVVGGLEPLPVIRDSENYSEDKTLNAKFPYTRPHFLQFHTDEEIQVSADHHMRPIIVPRDISKLPWNSGYAEAVNAGKSTWNEDQACLLRGVLQRPEARDEPEFSSLCLPYVYFSLFDGHAGVGAAVAAANQLHHIIHEKLVDVIDHLLPPLDGNSSTHLEATSRHGISLWFPDKEVPQESLIIGALESAFWDMDQLIAEDKQKYKMKGGCTALVALFILGKMYVANAGDSRAVLCGNKIAVPMSNDFTPESERQRVRHLAALQPELLGGEFTHLDYSRRPVMKDLGKRILYRDAYMTGWAYKTVTLEDLKIPVVYGDGKRSRVLATIGVTRGFGDHDLKALNTSIPIKPFLLSQPEVQVLDIKMEHITDSDVLVMGTDGLWDVTSNDKAADIVQRSLDHFPASDNAKYRYISAAQDLVMHSRGKLFDKNWRTSEGKAATIDDISVFVIPLIPYKREYFEWREEYDAFRDMYESVDPGDGFGKLSLRTSSPAELERKPASLNIPSEVSPKLSVDLKTTIAGSSKNIEIADCAPTTHEVAVSTAVDRDIITRDIGVETTITVTSRNSDVLAGAAGDTDLSTNSGRNIDVVSGALSDHDAVESVPDTPQSIQYTLGIPTDTSHMHTEGMNISQRIVNGPHADTVYSEGIGAVSEGPLPSTSVGDIPALVQGVDCDIVAMTSANADSDTVSPKSNNDTN